MNTKEKWDFSPKRLNSLHNLKPSPISKTLISYTTDIYSDITPMCILDNYHAKRILLSFLLLALYLFLQTVLIQKPVTLANL